MTTVTDISKQITTSTTFKADGSFTITCTHTNGQEKSHTGSNEKLLEVAQNMVFTSLVNRIASDIEWCAA